MPSSPCPGWGFAGWVGMQGMPLSIAMVMAAMFAVGANFCFLLGQLAELYVRGLFRNGQPLGCFGAGVFAAALAGVWLV